VLELFWFKLALLVKANPKQGADFVASLQLTKQMMALSTRLTKTSNKLAYDLSFLISRALLRENTPEEQSKDLLKFLLSAFNRKSEDVSLAFKKKPPSFIAPQLRKKMLNSKPQIVDEELLERLDSDVLWAISEFTRLSDRHALLFLDVLKDRRVEFTSKITRLLQKYVSASDQTGEHTSNMSMTACEPIELRLDEARQRQWSLIVKPCANIVARLNSISSDFAWHFLTGSIFEISDETIKVGAVDKKSIANVVVSEYVSLLSDPNSVLAGLEMLLGCLGCSCMQSSETRPVLKKAEKALIFSRLKTLVAESNMFERLALAFNSKRLEQGHVDPKIVIHLLKLLRKFVKARNSDSELIKSALEVVKSVLAIYLEQSETKDLF